MYDLKCEASSFFPSSGRTSTAGAGRAMAPASSLTWWLLCQLRARLDSVCLHLSSRCGNLFWWNAEVSEALLNGNSSLAWLYIRGCEADALLPRTLTAVAAEQEILLAFLTSISICGGIEKWVSCVFNEYAHGTGEAQKTVWSSVKTFNLQDFCSECSLAVPWDEVLTRLMRKNSLCTQAKATVSISMNPIINQSTCKRIHC